MQFTNLVPDEETPVLVAPEESLKKRIGTVL
jgi:hypothetical protein